MPLLDRHQKVRDVSWNKIRYLAERSPVVWGVLATLAFFGLLYVQLPELLLGGSAQQFLVRYCAGHPINATEVGLFFVGMAALVIKLRDVVRQTAEVRQPLWEGETPQQSLPAACRWILEALNRAPYARQQGYLVQRLRAAIVYLQQKGTADGLDDELKHLAEADSGRMYNSYALSRLTVWAVPIMGFLGTVVGITMAITTLDPKALETSMGSVVGGLGVAFDTTALALVLSMIQMFLHFAVEKKENRLLELVEERVAGALLGLFPHAAAHDSQLVAVRRIGEEMLKSTEQLVRTQAALWQQSLDHAQARWTETASGAGKTLQAALEGALSKSLEQHASHVAAAAKQLSETNLQHWRQIEQVMSAGAQATLELQAEMVRQGHLLQQLIHAQGQVVKLEDALNRNLASLAGAHQFEETLASLAAVIHLLNARLAHLPPAHATADSKSTLGRAA